jgi:hypothetical protein
MQNQTDYLEGPIPAQPKSDWQAILFVGGVWLIMILIALNFMVQYGSKIPVAEDWLMVSPLVGKEWNMFRWAWTQVNEHRMPLPRVIYLVLLEMTKGDFRVGGFFNIALLGALSLAMIWTIRQIRGGKTHFVDAFFPLLLLHLSHSANLLMGWQITQVFPSILVGVILLLFVSQKTFATPEVAILAGVCLIMLPLCGANGLLYVPILVGWLSYCGILHWRAMQAGQTKWEQRWISVVLIGSSAIALGLTVFYFVGYRPASYSPPSPGLGATLATTVKILALGWGPFVSYCWLLSGMFVLLLLSLSAGIVVLGILRNKGLERHQALGILLLLGNMVLFALVVGHGRAGRVPISGLPIRYVIFTVPIPCAVFLLTELYGVPKPREIMQRGLLVVMLLILPLNTVSGFYGFTVWYRKQSVAIERQILSGTPMSSLVQVLKKQHPDFVGKFRNAQTIQSDLQMLYDIGVEPFSQIKPDAPAPADAGTDFMR